MVSRRLDKDCTRSNIVILCRFIPKGRCREVDSIETRRFGMVYRMGTAGELNRLLSPVNRRVVGSKPVMAKDDWTGTGDYKEGFDFFMVANSEMKWVGLHSNSIAELTWLAICKIELKWFRERVGRNRMEFHKGLINKGGEGSRVNE
jgi:hypothetical protein